MTWVKSKLSGLAGLFGVEVIEAKNLLLHFGCASEELLVVVYDMAYCHNNYCPLYHLLFTDGVPVGGPGKKSGGLLGGDFQDTLLSAGKRGPAYRGRSVKVCL